MAARQLPSGTVTLLFTDIEGSTALLQELGRDRYVRALTDHRRLLREAFTTHGGVEVEMQGDSFHFAFASARDAVRAALAGQRSLAEHTWASEPIKVRMGVHTGEPIQADGLYAGLDVHRAARIMSVGHGGQILVSDRTAALAGENGHGDMPLIDLGEHRLKDLAALQRLYQVGRGDFPAPDALRPQLPMPLTRFVGRHAELQAIVERLDGESRLLTLIGPGGVGKTRLALQAAFELRDRFPAGVIFVPLASLHDPAELTPAIAKAVGARDRAGTPLIETLAAFLRGRRLLLVLDNFEQLVDASTDVAELLRAAPDIRVVVTSREALRIHGESVFPVSPLPVPGEEVAVVADIADNGSVQLFVDRARAVNPMFALSDSNSAVVAAICAKVDGLPLAIELAAARLGVLSPDAILRRLDHRLELLVEGTRDVDARQRTLEAAISWSYDLLNDAEQRVFARVSMFPSGCRAEAAAAVLDPDGTSDRSAFEQLSSLTSKSLLRRHDDGDGEPRFTMLQTVREYASGRLDAGGEAAETRARYVAWCVRFAEESARGLRSPLQLQWMERLAGEYENLRVGIELALLEDTDSAQRLVGRLGEFWDLRGDVSEGTRWTEAVLAQDASGSPRELALARLTDGILALTAGDLVRALAQCEQVVDEARKCGDDSLRARALVETAWGYAMMLQFGRVRPLCEEALPLAEACGDPWTVASAIHCVAVTLDLDEARPLFERSERIFREAGDSIYRTRLVGNHGWKLMSAGEYEQAAPYFVESLALSRDVDDVVQAANSSVDLAICLYLSGERERVVPLLVQSLEIQTRVPSLRIAGECLVLAAALASSHGMHEDACRLAGAGQQWIEASSTSVLGHEQPLLAFLDSSPDTEREVAAGRSLSLDAAVRLALAAVRAAAAGVPPVDAR